MGADDGLATIFFAAAAGWEQWLEDNHAASDGVWIKMAKTGTGIDSVRYPEVLDPALCFGWIDGQRQGLDARYFLQRFTPRRARSKWSRINREKAERLIDREKAERLIDREKAERLIADGRMRAAGLRPSSVSKASTA
jgi:uncharacterized protein YdeI (YjbR/CyaY-like superfamily)